MNLILRTNLQQQDKQNVAEILISTGFFRQDEIEVAVSLVQEALENPLSGYEFLFAEIDNKTIAYTCFGAIPCSLVSWDLYWIATHNDYRNKGIGKILLQKTEEIVGQKDGKSLYIETSSKPLYEPTRQFYLRCGYELKAVFDDFYDIGDNKCVFVKRL